MTSQDKQRVLDLCQRIMVEENYSQMIRLVQELNDVFDATERQRRPAPRAWITSPQAKTNSDNPSRGD
jgi:hypothetical protein